VQDQVGRLARSWGNHLSSMPDVNYLRMIIMLISIGNFVCEWRHKPMEPNHPRVMIAMQYRRTATALQEACRRNGSG
jgi:hypothetical protein